MKIYKAITLIVLITLFSGSFYLGLQHGRYQETQRRMVIGDLRILDDRLSALENQTDDLENQTDDLENRFNQFLIEELYVLPTWETREKNWAALCWVESRHDPMATNPSGAVGIAQIKKVCVDDVNRILGEPTFSYLDRFDPIKARQMFEIYTTYYGAKDFEDRARIWYSGPDMDDSDAYWRRIEDILE